MRNLLLLATLMALLTMSVACSTANTGGNDAAQDEAAAEAADAGQGNTLDTDNESAGDMNEDAEHEDGDDDMAQDDDDAENEDGDGDMAHDDDDAENEDSDEVSDGQGMGHRRNEDEHHREMLDEAIALGLITDEDAEFFLKAHVVLDETSPRPMKEGEEADAETKKTLQRGRTEIAVAAGALSQADADRFTEIHDLLIENDLMDH